MYVCELIYLLCATDSLHNVQFENKATTTKDCSIFVTAKGSYTCRVRTVQSL